MLKSISSPRSATSAEIVITISATTSPPARSTVLKRLLANRTALLFLVIASLYLIACNDGLTTENKPAPPPSGTGGVLGGYPTPAESLGYPLGTELVTSRADSYCKPGRDNTQQAEPTGLVLNNLRCVNEYQPGKAIRCFFSVENRSDTATEALSAQLLLKHEQLTDIDIGSCHIPPIAAKAQQKLDCQIANVPSVKTDFNQNFYWYLTHPNLYQGSSSYHSNITIGPIFQSERVLISDGKCTITSNPNTIEDSYDTNCDFTVSNVGAAPTTAVIQFSVNQQASQFSGQTAFECPVPEIPVGGIAEAHCLASPKVNPSFSARIAAIARIKTTSNNDFNWQQITTVDDGDGSDIPLLMDCPKSSFLGEELTECIVSFSNTSKQAKAAETLTISAPFQLARFILMETRDAITFDCHLPERAAGEIVRAPCQGQMTSYDAYPELGFDVLGGFDRYCIQPKDFGLELIAGTFGNSGPSSTTIYLRNTSETESSPDAYLWLRDIDDLPSSFKSMIPPIKPGESVTLEVNGAHWDNVLLGKYGAGSYRRIPDIP